MAKKVLTIEQELRKRVQFNEPILINEAKAANWSQQDCYKYGYTEELDGKYLVSLIGKQRIERYRIQALCEAYTPTLFPNRVSIFQKYMSDYPLMDGILVIANVKPGDVFELCRDEKVEVVSINEKAVTLLRQGIKNRINFKSTASRKSNPIGKLCRDLEGRLLYEVHAFREETPLTNILMRDPQAFDAKKSLNN